MDAMSPLPSPLLASVPALVHGFGRRVPGSRAVAREAAQATFADAGRVYFLRQVHGCRVVTPPWEEPPDADASSTDEAGALLAIETADCLPVLIVDPVAHRVAAAHAGWRGTAAGIVGRAVAWLAERGSAPRDLQVALGPCIGPCCYEVGDELRNDFAEPDRAFFVPGPQGRPHLDVRGINVRQLVAAGVPRDNIAHVDECTRCRPDLYCSYRRDGRGAGRMISYVGWTA